MKTTKNLMNDNFCDYTNKIDLHLSGTLKSKEINNFIIFLNWCFNERNNFLINNFNKTNLIHVLRAYNKIKTNILSNDYSLKIFDNLTKNELKILKFICFNLLNKHDEKNPNTQQIISLQEVKSIFTHLCDCISKTTV